MAFTLPDLPYGYSELEPSIDIDTMTLHHDKHHNTYVTKLNNAIQGTELENKTLQELMENVSQHPTAVRNNGGGHFNHSLFWQIMSPNGGGQPSGDLASAIQNKFGSFDNFKEEFGNAAKSVFGSGWAWLVVNNGEIAIGNTPNQDNPVMDVTDLNGTPILGLDMWEHAFYLKYQNRKDEYINAWWNVVNWDEVQNRYNDALNS